jgi:hypothetical protein
MTAYEAVLLAESRRDRLDKAITEMAADPAWAPVVTRLQCLRGVSTLTAFGLAVEIGDWHRFTGATLPAYLGLVPSEQAPRSEPRAAARGPSQAPEPSAYYTGFHPLSRVIGTWTCAVPPGRDACRRLVGCAAR